MAEGDFSRHFNINTTGEFKKNADKAMYSMHAVGEAITTLNTVMASLSKGDCSQRVSAVEEFSASTETMAEQANNVQTQIGFFKVHK